MNELYGYHTSSGFNIQISSDAVKVLENTPEFKNVVVLMKGCNNPSHDGSSNHHLFWWLSIEELRDAGGWIECDCGAKIYPFIIPRY